MNINKIPNGVKVNVDSHEIIDYFLKLSLRQLKKTKKPYRYSAAYATSFRIDIIFIETPSKKIVNKRKIMLEKAKTIKLKEFIEEFRSTGTKENQRLISQFCNAFKPWDEESLEFLVSKGKKNLLFFRKVGPISLNLFEKFLKSKGFVFATWNGIEWV